MLRCKDTHILAAFEHFCVAGYLSFLRPPVAAAAEQAGLTAADATTMSPRPLIKRNCGLAAMRRRCSHCYCPPSPSRRRTVANRYVRPPVVRRRCRENVPSPSRIAPPRARLARGSSQGELPVFYCCLLAMVGPWGSFLFPCP